MRKMTNTYKLAFFLLSTFFSTDEPELKWKTGSFKLVGDNVNEGRIFLQPSLQLESSAVNIQTNNETNFDYISPRSNSEKRIHCDKMVKSLNNIEWSPFIDESDTTNRNILPSQRLFVT